MLIKHKSFFNYPFSIVCLLYLPSYSFCQETIEEKLLEEQTESSDQSELLEIITSLRDNPIDINTANLDELKMIPGLTSSLQVEIIHYRLQNGPFSSIEDLLSVPGMDKESLNNIRDFLTVTKTQLPIPKKSSYEWRSRVSNRIDRPRGFKDGTYESSSQKLYHRIRFQMKGKVQGGLLLEKDSGEKRWDDLKLYYVSVKFNKNFSLLFGNYLAGFGQGLVLWGPYGFSKGAASLYPIKKHGQAIRGYLTVDENASFFGGAAIFNLGHLQLFSFASKSKRDATTISDEEISGFYITGFHRNATENAKKDLITESVFGGRVKYKISLGSSIGATYYLSTFDKNINNPDFTRNRFSFRGEENTVGGFDWDLTIKNINFFGEAAQSKIGGRAVVVGSTFDFPSIQLGFLFREYEKDYQNFHSFAFGENNGNSQNERGFYTGIDYRLTSNTKLTAYFDIFSRPWRTFFEPLPTNGKEFFSQIEHKIARQTQLTFRFREKYGQNTQTVKDALNRIKKEFVEKRRTQWRFQLEHHLSARIRLRGRIEFVRFSLNSFTQKINSIKEDGTLLYQDIRIKPKSNFQVNTRIIFFHTDSFNSRIFEFENDLPGVATNRALFGRGRRWYLLLRYNPLRISEISVKYSETYRDDVNTISSGPDQINGNLDRRLSVQIEMKI